MEGKGVHFIIIKNQFIFFKILFNTFKHVGLLEQNKQDEQISQYEQNDKSLDLELRESSQQVCFMSTTTFVW